MGRAPGRGITELQGREARSGQRLRSESLLGSAGPLAGPLALRSLPWVFTYLLGGHASLNILPSRAAGPRSSVEPGFRAEDTKRRGFVLVSPCARTAASWEMQKYHLAQGRRPGGTKVRVYAVGWGWPKGLPVWQSRERGLLATAPPTPQLSARARRQSTVSRPLNMNPENRFICKRSALLLSPGFPPEPRMDLASFPGGAGGAEQD